MYIDEYYLDTYVAIELDVEEIYDGFSSQEREYLIERFREEGDLDGEIDWSTVEFDTIYDNLDEGMKAHMFNRLLERDEFSHTNTNIARLVSALLKTSAAQSVTEV